MPSASSREPERIRHIFAPLGRQAPLPRSFSIATLGAPRIPTAPHCGSSSSASQEGPLRRGLASQPVGELVPPPGCRVAGAPVSDERGSRARLRFCLKPGPVYSAIVIDKVILRSSCVCRSLWVLDSCCFAHPLCLERETPQEVVASAVGSDRQKHAALGMCQ